MLRWKIDLPLLTEKYLKSLKMLVLFEFIPTKEIIGKIKEQVGIIKDEYETEEYENIFEDNTLLIIGLMSLIIILLVLLIGKCYCLLNRSSWFKSIY